ncbi:helix-turn-helix domain-containing protein [Jiella sonneratiae]|uniref:Helix-turn-helix transcriptional regulator n=1 Tax=Jiella sonneratiae TaxID=2816856 RepID=A0ABS3J303_9HYPH|nr:helix-turn-helix transcriptional regulator [Jiella sonneratiae]MBO0904048.1 helix-turn-helix transcriptional regulator [Jiella sonneratiae]
MARRQRQDRELDAAIGRRLRMHRLARGMIQMELARALGVSDQQIQKYEQGHIRLSASRLQRAAEVLDLPISAFLYEPAAPGTADDDLIVFATTVEGFDLNRAFAAIADRHVRRNVIRLVEAIAKDAAR